MRGRLLGKTGDLIAQNVNALFCFNDEMALGAISAVDRAGLSCPRDVSVIGFDDLALARFFRPGLTTIAQPKSLVGQRTVELLVEILSGRTVFPRQTTLSHALVVRDSTAARKNSA